MQATVHGVAKSRAQPPDEQPEVKKRLGEARQFSFQGEKKKGCEVIEAEDVRVFKCQPDLIF